MRVEFKFYYNNPIRPPSFGVQNGDNVKLLSHICYFGGRKITSCIGDDMGDKEVYEYGFAARARYGIAL